MAEPMQAKVTATPAALALIAEIVAEHGPVLFHQSGGCCDGSSPMCYPRTEFIVSDQDVLLGHIASAPFYIGASQIRGLEAYRSHHRRGAWPWRYVLAR